MGVNFGLVILLKATTLLLCALIGVAFLTLLERKVLSYIQTRKGPNKVGFMGLLQPFADAVKLFLKELIKPHSSNSVLFKVFPLLGFGVGFFLWGLTPSLNAVYMVAFGVILFLCISAVNVYIVLGVGWASNSLYALLGGLRASAQTISYEVSLVFLLLFPCIMVKAMMFDNFLDSFPIGWLLIYSTALWFLSSLAETNRAPFDFAEGESELVSGFNVEYGGGLFALLFLGEYATILFMSVLTSVCFMSCGSLMGYLLTSLGVAVTFLVVRGVYPRHRYDMLMVMCWKSVLPMSVSFLFLTFIVYWL